MESREPLPVSRAVEEAIRLAKAAGLKSVARNSVARRLVLRGAPTSRKPCACRVRGPPEWASDVTGLLVRPSLPALFHVQGQQLEEFAAGVANGPTTNAFVAIGE